MIVALIAALIVGAVAVVGDQVLNAFDSLAGEF
jgi:Flp pilus assembly pilin Flp